MRIFLAVFPPPATQETAYRVVEQLRRPGDGISWIKRENLHYTLSFLGELGEDGARRAAEAAQEAAAASCAFDAVLGRPGAFPKAERARLLWLGLTAGGSALETMARVLETALRKRGFDRDDRPFSAHLTIGRVREHDRDVAAALAGVTPLEQEAAARFRVATIRVIESNLSPGGSIYRVCVDARLAGAAPDPHDTRRPDAE